MRLPFLTATIWPYFLGLILISYSNIDIKILPCVLIFFSLVFLHIGTNLANDYFDYRYGADSLNRSSTKFSGGSRSIQNKEILPRSVLKMSISFFVFGGVLGIYIAIIVDNWWTYILGTFGLLSGYFYTAGPIRLAYRGLGEIFIALNLGPLITIGTFLVLTGSISYEVIFASVPLGILMFCMIILNQFPDYSSDKKAGKKGIVVRIGKLNSLRLYAFSIIFLYLLMLVCILLNIFPATLWIIFLTVPFSLKIIKKGYETYSSKKFVTVMMMNILLHSVFGILLILGYSLSKVI